MPTFTYVSHAPLLPDTSDQEALPELPELGGLSDLPDEAVPLPEGFKLLTPADEALYYVEPTGLKGQKPFHYRAYAHENFTTEVHSHLGARLRLKGRTKMKELATYLKQCEVCLCEVSVGYALLFIVWMWGCWLKRRKWDPNAWPVPVCLSVCLSMCLSVCIRPMPASTCTTSSSPMPTTTTTSRYPTPLLALDTFTTPSFCLRVFSSLRPVALAANRLLILIRWCINFPVADLLGAVAQARAGGLHGGR
jgi:hypothetical protein